MITKGFGLMASYAAEMTVEERWAVVAYVRALQLSQAVPLDQVPPPERITSTGTGRPPASSRSERCSR